MENPKSLTGFHTCPKLGIHWQSSPAFGSYSLEHPIFSTPLKQLISAATNLDSPESIRILSGIGILAHFPTRWTCSLDLAKASRHILANLESLTKIGYQAARLKSRPNLPTLHISPETRDLSNLDGWINSIESCLIELKQAAIEQANQAILSRLSRTEDLIISRIQSALHRGSAQTARLISSWAMEVGNIPDLPFYLPSGDSIPIRDYWTNLITLAVSNNDLEILKKRIDSQDLHDLIDHMESNLPLGTIPATFLLRVLRETKEMIESFRPTLFTPLSGTEPRREQFESNIEFIRAKLAWATGKSGPETPNTSNTISIEI